MYIPELTGKYSVSTMTFTVTDENRIEKYGPEAGKIHRTISSRIFYPVLPESTSDSSKAFLLSKAVCKGLSKEFFVKIDYDKKCASGDNVACYYENIKPMENEKFPLVIFNHGFKSYKEGNSYLCSEIASNGYIVISIGHTYASLGETHEDGTETFFDKYLSKKSTSPFLPGFLKTVMLTKPMLNKTAPAYYAIFKKIKHIGFADIKFFIPVSALTGKIPGEIMHSNLCKCHLDFLDKYLKKKDLEISIPNSKYIEFNLY